MDCSSAPLSSTSTWPPTNSSDVVAFTLPETFVLPDLLSIVSTVFKYDTSEHEAAGKEAGRQWMHLHKPMKNVTEIDRFLNKGNFARFASMSFPQAVDEEHFTTGYQFYLWAFITDDTWDDGGLCPDFTADHVQEQVSACCAVLDHLDPADAVPSHPFAVMLQSILVAMSKTSSPGSIQRFGKAIKAWSCDVVTQCRRRSEAQYPSVQEYIDIRRRTIGQELVEAILEYVVNAQIPDYVFEHPTIIAMSQITNDILTWPNDLISFNKEQADGDYQNFICILMRERNIDLQLAVDTLTDMIADRVREYAALKASLPSFGPAVDSELARYLAELEHEAYASVRWYYESPRYWRGQVDLNKDLLIEVFPSKI